MSSNRLNIGRRGEDIAAVYLEHQGYQIITRNYRTRLGEIDIIARDKSSIVFIEVKSKTGKGFGLPVSAVTLKKQRQISKVALFYLSKHGLADSPARFDVVSVQFSGRSSEVELITDAFELCY
ncbi:MAG: YraN family protein [Desulforhopalus sp.]